MFTRSKTFALLLLASVATSGCYEMAWFYPAPGQGELVSNGERLGVARRLSEGNPGAQSFMVLAVKEAYTTQGKDGAVRTVIQATINVYNQASAPAMLDIKRTQLEIAGRSFSPYLVYRVGGVDNRTPKSIRAEVAPNIHGRFDLFFDLGQYHRTAQGMRGLPMSGGIPLSQLREFHFTWAAQWAGRDHAGKIRFVRDFTGGVGGGWTVAPGPRWGWGWWGWSYSWPRGSVIMRPHYPWRSPSRPSTQSPAPRSPKMRAPRAPAGRTL